MSRQAAKAEPIEEKPKISRAVPSRVRKTAGEIEADRREREQDRAINALVKAGDLDASFDMACNYSTSRSSPTKVNSSPDGPSGDNRKFFSSAYPTPMSRDSSVEAAARSLARPVGEGLAVTEVSLQDLDDGLRGDTAAAIRLAKEAEEAEDNMSTEERWDGVWVNSGIESEDIAVDVSGEELGLGGMWKWGMKAAMKGGEWTSYPIRNKNNGC